MKKIRTIIIEDLDKDYDLLRLTLGKYHSEIEVIGRAKGVLSAHKLILESSPDLVFFDIEIEEDGTSFDVIDRLLSEGSPVTFEAIFMTAYREYDYSTRAFEYAAIDYLTKPIDKASLSRAVDRLKDRMSEKEAAETLQGLIDILKSGTVSDRLTIHLAGGRRRVIPINDINYVTADGVMSDFHMVSGEVIKAYRNLGKYRKILELDHNFFSIRHNLTVNLDHMTGYDHARKEISIADGESLQPSRQGGLKLHRHLKENNLIPRPNYLERVRSLLGILDK